MTSSSSNFISRNQNLQIYLKDKFPNTYKIIEYNAKGTFLYLKHKDVVHCVKKRETIGVHHTGNNNFKSGTDYKKAVDEYLKRINNDERLKKASETIANKIKEKHYKKFPNWPSVGKEQSATVDITCMGSYIYKENEQNDYTNGKGHLIAYVCEGIIMVIDQHPTSDKYYAEFHGNPTIKIVYINLLGLEMFEKQVLAKPEKIKKHVDNLLKKNKQKQNKLWDTMGDSDSEDDF